MVMLTRTWPYGTRKTGTVVDHTVFLRCSTLIVKDDTDAYCLIDGPEHFDALKEGDSVTIEFLDGGPMGSYWDVVR